MATDRTQLTRQQQQWIETIEADPDLFLALAEETGLAQTLRNRMAEKNAAPSAAKQAALRQLKDQRNALARSILDNARRANLTDDQTTATQPMRMVELVRLVDSLGDSAKKNDQATRELNSLTQALYATGLALNIVSYQPNPQSSTFLQNVDAYKIIQALQQQGEQRNKLLRAAAEAAVEAGLVDPNAELTGQQIMLLINDLGLAAKETVARNEALSRKDHPGDRMNADTEVLEALKRLDKSYYAQWRKDVEAGTDQTAYVSGNIRTLDLSLVVEYARCQLNAQPNLQATESSNLSSLSLTQQTAIKHAMDIISQHGNGTVSLGALEVLDELLEERATPNSPVPAVTDNVMRKANQVIGEMTGNRHIGVTAKVINAIWNALKEDLDPASLHVDKSISEDTQATFKELKRVYSGIRNGDPTLTDEDFQGQVDRFIAQITQDDVLKSGDAGVPLTDQQKAHTIQSLQLLQSMGARAMTSPGAMKAVEEMMDAQTGRNRTPTQGAQESELTLNQWLNDDDDTSASLSMG